MTRGRQRLIPGLGILILTLIPQGPRLTSQTHQFYQHHRIHNFQQLLHFINPQLEHISRESPHCAWTNFGRYEGFPYVQKPPPVLSGYTEKAGSLL